jgi:hypothetical protein
MGANQGYAPSVSQPMHCIFLIIWIKHEQSLVGFREIWPEKNSFVVQPRGTCVLFFPLNLSMRKKKQNNTLFICIYNVIWLLHDFIIFIFPNSGCKGTPFCTGRQAWSIS